MNETVNILKAELEASAAEMDEQKKWTRYQKLLKRSLLAGIADVTDAVLAAWLELAWSNYKPLHVRAETGRYFDFHDIFTTLAWGGDYKRARSMLRDAIDDALKRKESGITADEMPWLLDELGEIAYDAGLLELAVKSWAAIPEWNQSLNCENVVVTFRSISPGCGYESSESRDWEPDLEQAYGLTGQIQNLALELALDLKIGESFLTGGDIERALEVIESTYRSLAEMDGTGWEEHLIIASCLVARARSASSMPEAARAAIDCAIYYYLPSLSPEALRYRFREVEAWREERHDEDLERCLKMLIDAVEDCVRRHSPMAQMFLLTQGGTPAGLLSHCDAGSSAEEFSELIEQAKAIAYPRRKGRAVLRIVKKMGSAKQFSRALQVLESVRGASYEEYGLEGYELEEAYRHIDKQYREFGVEVQLQAESGNTTGAQDGLNELVRSCVARIHRPDVPGPREIVAAMPMVSIFAALRAVTVFFRDPSRSAKALIAIETSERSLSKG